MNKVAKYIRQIVGDVAAGHVIATVISVEDYSCTVKTKLSDVKIPGIRLNAQQDPHKGIIIKPTVGSDVLLGALSEIDLYVAMFSEIDSVSVKIGSISIIISSNDICLNENQACSYLTDINKLVEQINEIKQDVNNLKNALVQFTPTGTLSDTASLKIIVTPWTAQLLMETTVDELADKKVKH